MAAVMKYKFTLALRTSSDQFKELTTDQVIDPYVDCEEKKTTPVLYETLFGACVPCCRRQPRALTLRKQLQRCGQSGGSKRVTCGAHHMDV